jgi:hypothetical protein
MDRYLWNFKDGSTSKIEDPSHTYRKPGTYTVRLTAVKCRALKRCNGQVIVRPLSACG